MTKLAFFDAKEYDKNSFDIYARQNDIEIKYYEPRLTIDTVSLAKGYDAVCVFVNDIVNKEVVEKLKEYGIKVILLRCAGFNNVVEIFMFIVFQHIHRIRLLNTQWRYYLLQ